MRKLVSIVAMLIIISTTLSVAHADKSEPDFNLLLGVGWGWPTERYSSSIANKISDASANRTGNIAPALLAIAGESRGKKRIFSVSADGSSERFSGVNGLIRIDQTVASLEYGYYFGPRISSSIYISGGGGIALHDLYFQNWEERDTQLGVAAKASVGKFFNVNGFWNIGVNATYIGSVSPNYRINSYVLQLYVLYG